MLLALIFSLFIPNWTSVAADMPKHVGRLESSIGTCSVTVVEVRDGIALAFTAGHCIPPEGTKLEVNGESAIGVTTVDETDLALITFKAGTLKPMKLASSTPSTGTPIGVAGFAFGDPNVAMQFGHVSQGYDPKFYVFWADLNLVVGDSGGPLVNMRGELIGLAIQRITYGPSVMSIGIPVEVLKLFLSKYHAK